MGFATRYDARLATPQPQRSQAIGRRRAIAIREQRAGQCQKADRGEVPGHERIHARAREYQQRDDRLERCEPAQTRADDHERAAATAAGERDRQSNAEQEQECERAGRERECRTGQRQTAPPQLKGGDGAEEKRDSERIGIEAGEQRKRGSSRERAGRPARVSPPLARRDQGEEPAGRCRAGDQQRPNADQRRKRRLEDAIGDERVVARVPVVVPQQHALTDERRAIDMRGQVRAGGASASTAMAQPAAASAQSAISLPALPASFGPGGIVPRWCRRQADHSLNGSPFRHRSDRGRQHVRRGVQQPTKEHDRAEQR